MQSQQNSAQKFRVILNFIWNHRRCQVAKTNSRKVNKARDIMHSYFETYHKYAMIKHSTVLA